MNRLAILEEVLVILHKLEGTFGPMTAYGVTASANEVKRLITAEHNKE